MKVVKPNYISNICEVTASQRASLPISISRSGDVISVFDDILWDFTPYIRANSKNIIINFACLAFDDGSHLTDPQHNTLLLSVKTYFYARLVVQNGHKLLSYQSLIAYWESRVRPLIGWMVNNGFKKLSDLTSDACILYVEHCRKCYAKVGGGRAKRLAKNTLFVRYALLESFWAFREYLPDSLPQHPWPNQSAISLSGKSTVGGRETTTEQIPDRLMSALIQGALRYVSDGYGTSLLDCRDAHNEGRCITSYLKGLQIQNYRDHNDVLTEIRRLRTACFIIISAFSGMRISEVMSLEVGCYYEHEGWDGQIYGWLKGTTFKLEEDPMPAEWMVPPVVKDAIDLLTRVSAPIRAKLGKKIEALQSKLSSVTYLDEALRRKDEVKVYELEKMARCLFLVQYGHFSHMTEQGMREALRPFCDFLRLKVEFTDLEQVRDKSKVKVGEIWPLTSHQFRKTFARYVARCILGDVRYLREHFKHWSLDMTLSYAWNEDDILDPTLIDEILDEHQELQSEIVQGWVDFNRNQALAGVGGKAVESVRGRSRVLVATDPGAVARQISKGYFLRGLGHSWCTEKECRGKGIYSVTECKECENRIIDESHIPMWKGVRQQQIDLLHCDDCGDPMWEGALESLRYAEKVLTELGEIAKPYEVPPRPSERRRRA